MHKFKVGDRIIRRVDGIEGTILIADRGSKYITRYPFGIILDKPIYMFSHGFAEEWAMGLRKSYIWVADETEIELVEQQDEVFYE